MRQRFSKILFFAGLLVALLAWGGSHVPWPRPQLEPRSGPPLTAARAWGYQLQGVQPGAIAPAIDMLVVDYSRDGTAEKAWSRTAVEALKLRANGSRRTVLAYVSIGEAERYRYYWWWSWSLLKPRWLGPENQEWKGNYRVDYWDKDWQRIFVDPRPDLLAALVEQQFPWLKPYIDRVIEAGFDGVYLDRVDAFEDFAEKRSSAEREMIDFVVRLSQYAKARKPGFLVVPQNGEGLLVHENYLAAIDGFAKEDLYFGAEKDGIANDHVETEGAIPHLLRARARGLPVFVVEYVAQPDVQQQVMRQLSELGFVPLFARRDLNTPPRLPPPLVAADPAAAPRPAN